MGDSSFWSSGKRTSRQKLYKNCFFGTRGTLMNKKNQPKRCKMHVKVGDNIQVISGKDKGKIGEITKIFPKTSQVIIKGTNVKTKHVKPQQEGESGQITTFEAPIHSSSVMLYSSKKQVASTKRERTDKGKGR